MNDDAFFSLDDDEEGVESHDKDADDDTDEYGDGDEMPYFLPAECK